MLAAMLARYARQLPASRASTSPASSRRAAHVEHELAALRARRVLEARRRGGRARRHGLAATAIPALIDALDDRERDVRAAAARGLGLLERRRGGRAARRRARAGRVPRAVAGWALLQIGAPARARPARPARAPTTRPCAPNAVELLGLTGDGVRRRPSCIALLRDPIAPRSRAKCAPRALGRLGAGEAAAGAARRARRPHLLRPRRGRPRARPDRRPRRVRRAGPPGRDDRFEPRRPPPRRWPADRPARALPRSADAAAPASAHLREAAGLAGDPDDATCCATSSRSSASVAIAYFAVLNLHLHRLHRPRLAVDHAPPARARVRRRSTRRSPRR